MLIYHDMVGISCISIILKHIMIGQKLHENEVRECEYGERRYDPVSSCS